MVTGAVGDAPRDGQERRVEMRTPEEVSAIVRLKALGWGVRRIAGEIGCSHMTVRRYLAQGAWAAYRRPERGSALAGLEDWLAERFRRHGGNADVVRQELASEHGITVSLRTVERAVAPLRRELEAAAKATVRFETRPGHQLQIAFGARRVEICGRMERVFVFVATLGYSRRMHVRAFRHERQETWLFGIESAFLAFGGVPEELLLDNARALILRHDRVTRSVTVHPKRAAFARHWQVRIQACAPYRARTKGPDQKAGTSAASALSRRTRLPGGGSRAGRRWRRIWRRGHGR